ncbi:MAG: hypothetical protein ACLFOY_16710 [Desulfatibacillaceae bacterium]
MKTLDLVEFKYVYCPVIEKEIRLKRGYEWTESEGAGPKHLVDCVGAFTCGVGYVEDGQVHHDFSRCPFHGVRFMADRAGTR